MNLPILTHPDELAPNVFAAFTLLMLLGVCALAALIGYYVRVHTPPPPTAPRTVTLALPAGCAPPTEQGDTLTLIVRVDAKGAPHTDCKAQRRPQ